MRFHKPTKTEAWVESRPFMAAFVYWIIPSAIWFIHSYWLYEEITMNLMVAIYLWGELSLAFGFHFATAATYRRRAQEINKEVFDTAHTHPSRRQLSS